MDFVSKYEEIKKLIIEEIVSIIGKAKRRMKRDLSPAEIESIIDDFPILERMKQLGLGEEIYKYIETYDDLVISKKGQLGNKFSIVVDHTDLIKNRLGEYLLGNASNYTDVLKLYMVQNLSGEITTDNMIENLKVTGQTPAQLGAVINTAYHNHSRNVTSMIFEDNTEQRFRYEGGLIPTSNKICKWLVTNQKKEGYTQSEIHNGIETPFGKVNWFGRIPNFNCIHEWLPITQTSRK